MGGTDDPENLVNLTPEEHYVAHQLLVKMYPNEGKLVYAVNMMTVEGLGQDRPNKRYGWIRRRYSAECKKRIGAHNGSYGRLWYHDPKTLDNGKFFPQDVPEGWAKGRVPKIFNLCGKCSKNTGSTVARFCVKHRNEERAKINREKKKSEAISLYQEYMNSSFPSIESFAENKNTSQPRLSSLWKRHIIGYSN